MENRKPFTQGKCSPGKSGKGRKPFGRWSRTGVAILLILFAAQAIGAPVHAADNRQDRLPAGYYEGTITISAFHGYSWANQGAEEASYLKIFTLRGRIRFRILSSGHYSHVEVYFPYVIYYHGYYQYVSDAIGCQGFAIAARGVARAAQPQASGAPNLIIGTEIYANPAPMSYENPSIAYSPFGDGCVEDRDMEFQSLRSVLEMLFRATWVFRANPPFGSAIGGECGNQTLDQSAGTNWTYNCSWRAPRTGR